MQESNKMVPLTLCTEVVSNRVSTYYTYILVHVHVCTDLYYLFFLAFPVVLIFSDEFGSVLQFNFQSCMKGNIISKLDVHHVLVLRSLSKVVELRRCNSNSDVTR